MKIYVPSDDYACYYMIDSNTIRAYNTQPRLNSNVDYTDYYVNSHYLFKNGTQSFGQYSTLPTCIGSDYITENILYRNDLSDTLVIFLIIVLFAFYLPYKIISRGLGRWLKI